MIHKKDEYSPTGAKLVYEDVVHCEGHLCVVQGDLVMSRWREGETILNGPRTRGIYCPVEMMQRRLA